MKSCLRSIQLLLIILLISAIGITPVSSRQNFTFPEPFNCYTPYETIINRMVALTTLYPDLAQVKTIGQSSENLPILALQLGREVETNTKPRLVLVSGLQANALAPVELNLRFAEFLLSSYGDDANINWLLDQAEIHLILVANPDGRLFAEGQILDGNNPTWTKNRNDYACANGNGGVALGLNFEYEWSPDVLDSCSPDYPGPSAASELETQAIQNYLGLILGQNPERSFVIDLQNKGDSLVTPFLFSKTAENLFEEDLYMLASKLAYATEAIPFRGSSEGVYTIAGSLTDFAFGQLQAPSLRYNLGPTFAGGDVTSCWYYDEVLEPQGLASLTRAAILAADPLVQAQGPEITFSSIERDPYKISVVGQADDASFYKPWLNPGEYSAVDHVAFSVDIPPWFPDAVMFTVAGENDPERSYLLDFEHTLFLTGMTSGKHTLYFQAWDTHPAGDSCQAGMINAMEINVPLFTFIPLLIR